MDKKIRNFGSKFSHSTFIGRRTSNQDRIFFARLKITDIEGLLLVVADGMGGQAAGGIAAQTAIDTVKKYCDSVFPSLPEIDPSLIRDTINKLYQEANRKIWEIGKENEKNQGLGTTLVLALVIGNNYIISNVGDSRCYYIHQEDSWQITEDHTDVAKEVRRGTMTEEAASKSPFRSSLYRSLGNEGEVEVDFFPGKGKLSLIDQPCALLLCSDGLWSDVSNKEIYEQIVGTPDIEKACANLVSLAYSKDSDDNITVAIAEFGKIKRAKKKIKSLPPVEMLAKKSGKETESKTLLGKLKRSAALLTVILIVLVGILLYQIKTSIPQDALPPKKQHDARPIKMIKKDENSEGKSNLTKEISKPGEQNQIKKRDEFNPLFKITPGKKDFLISELDKIHFSWLEYPEKGVLYQVIVEELNESKGRKRFLSEKIKLNEIKFSDALRNNGLNIKSVKYAIGLIVYKEGKKIFVKEVSQISVHESSINSTGERK